MADGDNFKKTRPSSELWTNTPRKCDEIRREISEHLQFMQVDHDYTFKLTLCRRGKTEDTTKG